MSGYETFTLGEWTVDPAISVIRNDTQRVNLQPHVMDLLVYLAEHHREVVSSDELMENLWEGKVVTIASIYSSLKLLREALGDDAQNPTYIETIPRRGYRLIAKLNFATHPHQDPSSSRQIESGQQPDKWLQWRKAGWGIIALVVGISLALVLRTEEPARLPGSPGNAPGNSIAVLPFTDLTPNQPQRWYSDGMAEEILNLLAQHPELKVAGRLSSFTFRQSNTELRSIGDTLGVANILRGKVVRNGTRVTMETQLIRISDGLRLWSHEYESDLVDTFDIQWDIFKNVANVLGVQEASVTSARTDSMQPVVTPAYRAYELYLQSLDLINQNTKTSLMAALIKLENALKTEPDYAKAHVAMARTYLKLVGFKGFYQEDWYAESRSLALPHAERALAINPDLADAHAALGHLTSDFEQSMNSFETALALNPNLYEVHLNLGVAMMDQLRSWNDIIDHLDRAVEIEPLSIEAATMLVLFLQRIPHRRGDAEEIIAKLARQHPDSSKVKRAQAKWLLLVRGSPSQAIPLLREAIVLEPDDQWARAWLKRAWYMLGETDRAMESQHLSPHWRYVLAPDRADSLRKMRTNPDWSEPWNKDIDFGRRLVSAYTYIMLRDWQTVIDLLAPEAHDLQKFSKSKYVQSLALNDSPALSLAIAYKKLGDQENFEKYAQFERNAVNVRTENGLLHNEEYSRAISRLDAMEGRPHEAMLELEHLITTGSIDPRDLLHPAFDDIRDDPEFHRIEDIQLQRINAERTKLGLESLIRVRGQELVSK